MLEAAKELNSGVTVHDNKRGFSSILGAATAITVDTGKCLDYEVCSVYIMGELKGY